MVPGYFDYHSYHGEGILGANLNLQLQLLVQQGPLLQDLSLQLFFVLVQQCSQLGGVLFGAFLLNHLLLLSLLSCLLFVFLDLVKDELHHLVAHNHSKKTKGQQKFILGKMDNKGGNIITLHNSDYQVPDLWFSSRSAAARLFLCFSCSAVALCFTTT